MAKKDEGMSQAAVGFSALPVTYQIAILAALAASIAVGAWVASWSMKPSFRPLFAHIEPRDADSMTQTLQQAGIKYRMDPETGTLLVEGDKVHDARMKLAAQGLPAGSGRGFELFNDSDGIGTSQFMEQARFSHALEVELSRTITTISSVKLARVHIAIPKQSAFSRTKSKPSASVLLSLYPGHRLTSGQISAISHMVASSVPGMTNNKVTIIDASGGLLNQGDGSNAMAIADRHRAYVEALEESYVDEVENILTPILGPNKVRAEVAVDVDFTQSSQTRESYDPDTASVRSEGITQEGAGSTSVAGGVPGSLSQQEPNSGATANAAGKNQYSHVARNYELDRTISHVEQQPGRIQRLSVAVVIDNKTIYDGGTEGTSTPLTETELAQVTELVRDAVGYNPQRGDKVTVVNSAFAQAPPVEPIPEPSLMEQGWFWDVVKQGAGGLFLLILVFGVLRPTLRNLAKGSKDVAIVATAGAGGQTVIGADGQMMLPAGAGAGGGGELVDNAGRKSIANLKSFKEQHDAIKGLAMDDPKRVAQVVTKWVQDEK